MDHTANIKTKNRKNYLDVVRGIAIFFVPFGHVTHVFELRIYILGFILPLFFFMSGLFFNPDKYANFKQFFFKKLKTLIIPYCIFYVVTFLYWLLVERKVRGADLTPWSQLFGMVYGTYNLKYMLFNGALWFLPCLFTTEMLYYFISKIRVKWGILITLLACYLTGILLWEVNISWLPWGGNAALFACVFYGLGNCLKNQVFSLEKLSLVYHIIIIIVCTSIQIALLNYTGTDLAGGRIENYFLCIPIGLIGTAAYLSISIIIRKNRILEYMGINSLVIFALQEPLYRAVIFGFSKILGWEIEAVRLNLFVCFLIAVVTILILTPAVFGYNKYIKPVLSK